MSATSSVAARPASEELQRLVDQVAGFHLFAAPDPRHQGAVGLRSPGAGGGVVGFRVGEILHRFAIDLPAPSVEAGARAVHQVGEAAGRLDLRWMLIPDDFLARPDREPPPTPLDRTRSQRLAMQEGVFAFGDGRDGWRSFGAGRTFPYAVAGRPRLGVAAVGDVTEGFGKLRGSAGNFTLCGELAPDGAFIGHVLIRLLDPGGVLRTSQPLPPLTPRVDPDPEATYLVWGAQKGTGVEQENRFSLAPDGQVRGLNIPVRLKRLELGFAADGPQGFRASDFKVGEVVGQEIGFGRGAEPGASPVGTGLRPFLFEGVARYALTDPSGREVGAITTNVLDGRRFDVRLPGAPEETAWRFGFFGPVVLGSGCFAGAKGMFYGVSGSILDPPPGRHVITHFYAARLHDPEGRFRARRAGS